MYKFVYTVHDPGIRSLGGISGVGSMLRLLKK
ncbi:unnamed protein product [Lathyrus sativus]|nr:unnamed protein product [Lathyrus sativus]